MREPWPTKGVKLRVTAVMRVFTWQMVTEYIHLTSCALGTSERMKSLLGKETF